MNYHTGIMSMFRQHNSRIINFGEEKKEDMRKFWEKISDKTKPQGTTLPHWGYPGQSALEVIFWRRLLIHQPVCLRKMILRGTQSLMLQIVEQIERNSRRRKKQIWNKYKTTIEIQKQIERNSGRQKTANIWNKYKAAIYF